LAAAAVEGVARAATIDRVVAAVAVEGVGPAFAVDRVVAAVAMDLVDATARVDRVGPDAAVHDVVAAVGLDQRALRQRAEARRTEDIDGVAAGQDAREEFLPAALERLVDAGGRNRGHDDGVDRAGRVEARSADDLRHRAADRRALADDDVGAEEHGVGAVDVLEGEAAEAAGYRAQRDRVQFGVDVDDVPPDGDEEAVLVVSHGRHLKSSRARADRAAARLRSALRMRSTCSMRRAADDAVSPRAVNVHGITPVHWTCGGGCRFKPALKNVRTLPAPES
jgi:hypothetical protein